MRRMAASDDDRTNRQIARSKRRRTGDKSADLALRLMKLAEPAVKRLALDDDLREVIDRARAVTAHVARRRAERALAGELRRYDLAEIAAELDKLQGNDDAEVRAFHLAEQWRARPIDEGITAAADFPGGPDAELPALIASAQRERTTGQPKGAARALFRHVVERLKR